MIDKNELASRIEAFLQSCGNAEPLPNRMKSAEILTDEVFQQLLQSAADTSETLVTRIRTILGQIHAIQQIAFATSLKFAPQVLDRTANLLRSSLASEQNMNEHISDEIDPGEQCCMLLALGQTLLILEPHTADSAVLMEEVRKCIAEVKKTMPVLAQSGYVICLDIQRLLRLAQIESKSQYIEEALQLCRNSSISSDDEINPVLKQLEAASLRELAGRGSDPRGNMLEAIKIQAEQLLEHLGEMADTEVPSIDQIGQIVQWIATQQVTEKLFPEVPRPFSPIEKIELLEKAKEYLPKSSFVYVQLLDTQAMVFDSLANEDTDNAGDHLGQAREKYEENLALMESGSALHAHTLLALANMEWKAALHEEYPMARLTRAWKRCQQARHELPEESLAQTQALLTQGIIRLLQSALHKDKSYFEEAIDLIAFAIRRARDSRNDLMTLYTSALYASLLVQVGRPMQAHAAYVIALEALERMRVLVPFEDERRNLIEQYASLYTEIVELCLSLADTDEEQQVRTGVWCEEAWRWVESGKARALRDLLQSARLELETEQQRLAFAHWEKTRETILNLSRQHPDLSVQRTSTEEEASVLYNRPYRE